MKKKKIKQTKKRNLKNVIIQPSTKLKNINLIMAIVEPILRKIKAARDNDITLCIHVWKKQGLKNKDTIQQFKENLLKHKYSNPDSITRIRRMLQKDNKSLQGKRARKTGDKRFRGK